MVYSHFHPDHAGNIKLFPKAKHVVQNAELKNAWWPEKFQRPAFALKDFDTKGHTQGHQSLMLKLPKTGYVILSGDAVYTAENEKGVVPGITWSANESMRSIDKLKNLRHTRNDQLWYSHEPAQYEAHKGKVFE